MKPGRWGVRSPTPSIELGQRIPFPSLPENHAGSDFGRDLNWVFSFKF